jgi:riboflavin kinase / FMN adenylyltransferase
LQIKQKELNNSRVYYLVTMHIIESPFLQPHKSTYLCSSQMKVYRSLEELPTIPNAIVTQGTFDGVHLAHKVIIKRLRQLAKQHQGETVVITFHPHPRMVLFPDEHGLRLLQTLDEKIVALELSSIDHLLVIPFTKVFSRLSSLQFIRDIVVNKIGTKVLVIGYDHRFGKNREGTFEHLNEFSSLYGFEVETIPEQDIDEIAVSSTRIRKALEAGNVLLAAKYLGRHYTVEGTVVKGKQLGRTIGFPTANIEVSDSNKLIPADGVYAAQVFINNHLYGGMVNIGYRPTVDGITHSIEVHLFDFAAEIYGETITIHFVDKLRNEMKFDGLQALQNQLEKDTLQAKAVLQKASQ